MATKFVFNGKTIKLAGIYSRITSGMKNPALSLDYGKILVIDTGSGAGWGFGSGIIGGLKSGADSVYGNITDQGDMKALMKGGLWWKLAEPLFKPDGLQSDGASEIEFVKAATTTPAEISYQFGASPYTGGLLTIQMRDEGIIGNGVKNGSVLTKGYAGVFGAGVKDPTKYVLKMLVGTYKGTDPLNSVPYDNIADTDTVPDIVAISPEVSNMGELTDWMLTDGTFNTLFKLKAGYTVGHSFTGTDIVNWSGLNLATGGTEVYSNTALDKILDVIVPDDYSLILSDRYNADSTHLYNTKLANHINGEAKFDKMLIIGGGNDLGTFQTNSLNAASTYNVDNIIIVHGGVKISDRKAAEGFFIQDSIFKAAAVAGRIAGLPPQVPVTFKGLNYSGERHVLTTKEQEIALEGGVLYTIWDNDFKKFIVAQGINTLQNNDDFINDDGTSYSIQIMRIAAQLNKEIIVNGKKQLFGNPKGVNQGTLSPQTISDWLNNYLKGRTVRVDKDDLLIGYISSSIVVTRKQDGYFCEYAFNPNGEITKAFFTGFMLN